MQHRAIRYLALTGAAALAACGPPSEAELAKMGDRSAIKLCWEDQGKKSLPPDSARFIAATCEKMEADFQSKYGSRP